MAAQMPMCNECSAPTFDPSRPRELVHYFEDLDDQFQQCGVIDLTNKNRWALHYVSIEIADLWESLAEWTTAATWDQIKDAVKKHYPVSQTTQRHTHHKLLTLIRDRAHNEFNSITEWSDYLNQYITISQYLITQQRLSNLEQRRHLLKSLTPRLHQEVAAYMRNVNPMRDPEELEGVPKIDKAICYCLHSPIQVVLKEPQQLSTPAPHTKQEPTDSIVELVSQLVQKELVLRVRTWGLPPTCLGEGERRTPGMSYSPQSETCHYCGHQGHMVHQCAVVDEDINLG
ncbi:hypothetical protein K503DRAFT_786483 [Rhizopogon vinicolor AM-OR11-026]|uniref:CCHC-type domain-containing protein n=1 Tax=Rhizopogon vinicolor AM-OR11-026 TaxID=1314800 RepID=A0A1B7MLJ3_9AGAM|nr:hypothetical protein K503DRAFT_786483 [Rhizopogon vinicolor AM-OR11-026]